MSSKPIPEFIENYMVNLNDKGFSEYQMLSNQYHDAVANYHENVYPKQAQSMGIINRAGGQKANINVDTELQKIDEQYKGKALDIACEHGYERPSKTNADKELTDIQSRVEFGKAVAGKDDFGLSTQDQLAKTAHAAYEAKHPISNEERADRQQFIRSIPDMGKAHEQSQQPQPQKNNEPQKEAADEKKENTTDKSGETRKSRYDNFYENSLSITKAVNEDKGKSADREGKENEKGFPNTSSYEQSLGSVTFGKEDRKEEKEAIVAKEGKEEGKDVMPPPSRESKGVDLER